MENFLQELFDILTEKLSNVENEIEHYHGEGLNTILAIKEGEKIGLKWSINEVKKKIFKQNEKLNILESEENQDDSMINPF